MELVVLAHLATTQEIVNVLYVLQLVQFAKVPPIVPSVQITTISKPTTVLILVLTTKSQMELYAIFVLQTVPSAMSAHLYVRYVLLEYISIKANVSPVAHLP